MAYEGGKFGGHVLTGLMAEAFLEGSGVVDSLANEYSFQLFDTVIVENGLIFLNILNG